MAEFHFVEDYETYVRRLISSYPIDEAMSLALGAADRGPHRAAKP